MAVMTAEGLVGRVTKVNQFSAQVGLLSTNTRTGKCLLTFNTILKMYLV